MIVGGCWRFRPDSFGLGAKVAVFGADGCLGPAVLGCVLKRMLGFCWLF